MDASTGALRDADRTQHSPHHLSRGLLGHPEVLGEVLYQIKAAAVLVFGSCGAHSRITPAAVEYLDPQLAFIGAQSQLQTLGPTVPNRVAHQLRNDQLGVCAQRLKLPGQRTRAERPPGVTRGVRRGRERPHAQAHVVGVPVPAGLTRPGPVGISPGGPAARAVSCAVRRASSRPVSCAVPRASSCACPVRTRNTHTTDRRVAPVIATTDLAGLSTERPAAVTMNSHITALAVARSLGRRGVQVVALDKELGGLAQHSRFIAARGLLPAPELDGGRPLRDGLLELAPGFPTPPVLFPTNDDWVLALARHREALQPHYLLYGPPPPVLHRVLSKTQLWRACTRLGIPTPRSWPLGEPSAAQTEPPTDVTALPYPVVLKPDDSRGFYNAFRAKVWVVATPTELLERRREAADAGLSLLAQELIESPAGGFVSFASYLSADGVARGSLTGRKLEQWPPGFGTCCLADVRSKPALAERGLAVLAELGYHGVSEIEFVLDPRTGEHLLLDVNPRVWKWVGLCVAAGVDLPWLAYTDAIGAPQTAGPARDGRRWTYLADYARLVRARGAVLPEEAVSHDEWVTLLSGRLPEGFVDGVHDPDDPEPSYDLLWAALAGGAGPGYSCAC